MATMNLILAADESVYNQVRHRVNGHTTATRGSTLDHINAIRMLRELFYSLSSHPWSQTVHKAETGSASLDVIKRNKLDHLIDNDMFVFKNRVFLLDETIVYRENDNNGGLIVTVVYDYFNCKLCGGIMQRHRLVQPTGSQWYCELCTDMDNNTPLPLEELNKVDSNTRAIVTNCVKHFMRTHNTIQYTDDDLSQDFILYHNTINPNGNFFHPNLPVFVFKRADIPFQMKQLKNLIRMKYMMDKYVAEKVKLINTEVRLTYELNGKKDQVATLQDMYSKAMGRNETLARENTQLKRKVEALEAKDTVVHAEGALKKIKNAMNELTHTVNYEMLALERIVDRNMKDLQKKDKQDEGKQDE